METYAVVGVLVCRSRYSPCCLVSRGNRGHSDDHERQRFARAVFGEAEEPRRYREERASDDVDEVVDAIGATFQTPSS